MKQIDAYMLHTYMNGHNYYSVSHLSCIVSNYRKEEMGCYWHDIFLL